MITRELVADLRPGDVVEYAGHPDLHGAKVTGPLRESNGLLSVAVYVVRSANGNPPNYKPEKLTLTVISRAPRPLYVNHSRTKPVNGDVIRDADSDDPNSVWHWWNDDWWWFSGTPPLTSEMSQRLRLLVDGETGQVVP